MEYQGKLYEKYTLASILFQVLKVLLIKRYSYQFFCFYQLLHLQISFFTFLALHSALSEKRFSAQVFTVLIDSLQHSNLLNSKNSLIMTKAVFFYLLFGCPPPSLGHCGGHSLTNPMLMTAFSLLCLEGH